MKHTKLPWEKNYKGSLGHIKSIAKTEKDKGKYPLTPTVCRFKELEGIISREEAEANAAFIVKAVNSHEKLLNALKKARPAVLWRETHLSAELDDLVKEIDEAIKEAE